MAIKEIHFRYQNEDYFISLPVVKKYLDSENHIYAKLQRLGFKILFDVARDVKGRYGEVIVDKPLDIFQNEEMEDVIFREDAGPAYLLDTKSLTIITYNPEWLKIIEDQWNKNCL